MSALFHKICDKDTFLPCLLREIFVIYRGDEPLKRRSSKVCLNAWSLGWPLTRWRASCTYWVWTSSLFSDLHTLRIWLITRPHKLVQAHNAWLTKERAILFRFDSFLILHSRMKMAQYPIYGHWHWQSWRLLRVSTLGCFNLANTKSESLNMS